MARKQQTKEGKQFLVKESQPEISYTELWMKEKRRVSCVAVQGCGDIERER